MRRWERCEVGTKYCFFCFQSEVKCNLNTNTNSLITQYCFHMNRRAVLFIFILLTISLSQFHTGQSKKKSAPFLSIKGVNTDQESFDHQKFLIFKNVFKRYFQRQLRNLQATRATQTRGSPMWWVSKVEPQNLQYWYVIVTTCLVCVWTNHS